MYRPQRPAIVAGASQGVVDLADRREEWDLISWTPAAARAERILSCQIAYPAADVTSSEFLGVTGRLHEVVRFRLIADNEMDLLHAPDRQPRENRL